MIATNRLAEPRNPLADDACRWDLLGALCKVCNRTSTSRLGPAGTVASTFLRRAIVNSQSDADVAAWREVTGVVEGFNDSENTSHEDVLTVLDIAIELADAQRTPAP